MPNKGPPIHKLIPSSFGYNFFSHSLKWVCVFFNPTWRKQTIETNETNTASTAPKPCPLVEYKEEVVRLKLYIDLLQFV
jgi:hypothetical protein